MASLYEAGAEPTAADEDAGAVVDDIVDAEFEDLDGDKR
jgi:molecular chaperone DnaK